jgi:hypothetical protein
MPPVVDMTKEWQLYDGRKSVVDFLNGLVVAFGNHTKREVLLTCFSDVDNAISWRLEIFE